MAPAPRIVSPNGTMGTQALLRAVDQADSSARGRTYIAECQLQLSFGPVSLPSSARRFCKSAWARYWSEDRKLTFSSTRRLRQVENPSIQKVSFRLIITFKNPFLVHLSRLLVRRQKSAIDQPRPRMRGKKLALIDDDVDTEEGATSRYAQCYPCQHFQWVPSEVLSAQNKCGNEM
jgi:hypothetical protein